MRAALFCLALLVVCPLAASNPPSAGGAISVQDQQAKNQGPNSKGASEPQSAASDSISKQSTLTSDSTEDAHKAYEYFEKPTLDRWLTWSTVGLAVFTFSLAVFTGLMWIATYRLAKDAKITSELAANQFAESHRAWISCQIEVTSGIRWSNGQGQFTVVLHLKNIGNRPARYVHPELMIYIMTGTGPLSDAVQQQLLFSDRVRQCVPPTEGGIGFTMFPGQAEDIPRTVTIPAHLIEAARAYYKTIPGLDHPMPVIPSIIGCVQYAATLGHERRQTGFVYDLYRPDPITGSAYGFRPEDGDVPLPGFFIHPSTRGGGRID